MGGKTNFFEKRVGEYQKAGVMASVGVRLLASAWMQISEGGHPCFPLCVVSQIFQWNFLIFSAGGRILPGELNSKRTDVPLSIGACMSFCWSAATDCCGGCIVWECIAGLSGAEYLGSSVELGK